MREETTPTEGTGANNGGRPETTSEPRSTFESLVGADDASWLAGQGLGEPTPLQSRSVPLIRAGKDCVVAAAGATEDTSAYLVQLLLEKKTPSTRGSTIVSVPVDRVAVLSADLAKAGLAVTPVTDATAGSDLLLGTAAEVKTFFGSELARAMSIGRVIVHGPGTGDTADTKELLGHACKRGRRPQLVLVTEEFSHVMQEMTRGSFQGTGIDVEHLFFEVGGEVQSKPTALCDFVEAEGLPPTLIYCNQPSDSDLVEVMLKKRGITCRKLIGHMAPLKIAQTIGQVKNGDSTALIVTDATSRPVEIGDFHLVVNYSIPSDPEVYVHRTDTSSGVGSLKKVISLVGPLDRANFHYLRKIVEATFDKVEPPAKDSLMNARLTTLRHQATRKPYLDEPEVGRLVELIEEDQNRREMVAYLVHNLLFAPTPSASERRGDHREEGFEDDRGARGQGQRISPGQGSPRGEPRARGDRRGGHGERDGNRGEQPGPRGEPRGDRPRSDVRQPRRGGPDGGERPEHGQPRQERQGRQHPRGPNRHRQADAETSGDESQAAGEEFAPRRGPRSRGPMVSADRTARIYVGRGRDSGLDATTLTDKAAAVEGVTPEQVKRVSVRGHYSFVDVADEAADRVIEGLNAGGDLFAKRAITLSAPRPPRPAEPEDDQTPTDVTVTPDDDAPGPQTLELDD